MWVESTSSCMTFPHCLLFRTQGVCRAYIGLGRVEPNVIVTWFIQTINYIYNLMKVIYPLIFFFKKKVIKFCFSTLSWRRRARLRIFKFEVIIKYNNLDYCYVNCPAATSTAVHIKFAETSSVSYLDGIYLTPLEPTWSLNFKMVACHVIDYLWFFISFLLAVYGESHPIGETQP